MFEAHFDGLAQRALAMARAAPDDRFAGLADTSELARHVAQEVAALKSLRDRGLGLLLGMLIVAAVLALGVRQAVTSLIGVLK